MEKLYSYQQASLVFSGIRRKILFCFLLLVCTTMVQHAQAQYCQPTWQGPSCGGNSDDIVNSFQMSNVNDQNIGCPPVDPNFIDKAANICVDVCAGGTYNITVTPGYTLTNSDEYFAVYIDFNGDGTFGAGEFFPLGNSTNGSAVTGSVTIPLGAPSQSTRLRVLCQSLGIGIAPGAGSSCGDNKTYGEAVDYCLTITGAPVINLGSDTEQCGGVRVLDAGNAGTGATYLWSDSTTNEILTASTSGNYSVTVTTGSACSASASANVYIKPVPIVDLGPDITTCGGTVALDAGNTGSTYLWSTGETTQDILVDSSAVYNVTVTNPNSNCPASDGISVTIKPAPTLNFGPSVAQCGGTVTLDAMNPGSAYLWSDGSSGQTLLITASGYYVVTVTNPDGCSVSAAQVVTINPVPPIAADTTLNICPDLTTNLLLLYPDLGYATYLWNTPTPAAVGAGTYILTVSNATGCTNSATVTVGNFPAPILSSPPAISVCPGSTTDLTLVYPNSGYSTYSWSPPTPTVATAGNYTLVVTNSDGCGATVTVAVTNYPKPNAGPDVLDSICPLTTLELDTVIPDTGYAQYNWDTPNPSFAAAGIYTLIVINTDGCADTAIVTVVNYELPVLTLPAFPNICITHAPFVLTGATPPGGVWEVDGVVQTVFYPDSEGIGNHFITYTFTTYAGCVESVDTSFVVHPQPFITTILPPQLCTTSTPLDLNDYFNPPGGFYQGLGVSGHYFYSTLSPPGGDTIVDIYTDSVGCMDTSTYFIKVQPAVHVLFSSSVADFTICTGQNITFTASGAVNYQFFVNDSAQGPASSDSTYTTNTLTNHSAVFVVGSNDCSSDTSEMIIIDVIQPPVVNAGTDTTIQLGQSVQLHGTASGATALIYLWYPDSSLNFTNITNPTYSGSDSIMFWFRATDTYGCSDSASVNVYVAIPDNVQLPNIITPNGDGKNDVWKLNPKINLDGSHLVIFNRWGETVYEADNYQNDWGGTYKGSGKALPDGTYYYVLNVPAQHNHTYKGAINVLSGVAK